MDALRFSSFDVVFQEVPGEVTLAINITGCPHRCPGCHSAYLQEYFGEPLLDNLVPLLERYKGMITCVCFMGGDQNMLDLEAALRLVKVHSIKTGVYSGLDDENAFKPLYGILDYLKIGPYKEVYGGLASQKTNQRFYKIKNGRLFDVTEIFWNKGEIL